MATDEAPEFIEFLIRPRKGTASTFIKVALREPICLYDMAGPYRAAKARASRKGRRELELHPCSPVTAEPHDWSDGVDKLTEATIGRPFAEAA
jgi:hypothetical protein